MKEKFKIGEDDEAHHSFLGKRQLRNRFKSILKKRLPILSWLPKYTLGFFLYDLLAGFTVTLTQIPQGIAYAIVAGLPTEYGIYAGIMGGSMYFIFGGCKDINIGPTAILALIVQPYVTLMGPDGAILITFTSGFFIFLAGVLHLGFLVEFFSYPVISGFTTAAAISIGSTQLKSLMGIPGPSGTFLEAWESFFRNIRQTRKWDATLGFTSIIILLALREIRVFGSLKHRSDWSTSRNVLGNFVFYISLGRNALVVMAGTTIAYVAEKYYNSTPFVLTGNVQSGLPSFGLPPFGTVFNGTDISFSEMLHEYGLTLAFCPLIALLGHVSIVKAFTKGQIIDATQELIALGICNMAGSLVRSMPTTGSFTRTAVNNSAGVKTTAAGLITSLMLLSSLTFLTGTFTYIPRATLAAVIIVAMYYLCEFETFVILWKTKKLDFIPFLLTLLCCLLISLEFGILLGIGANLVFVLYEGARPKLYIERLSISDKTVYIVKPKSGLYFPSSEHIRQKVLNKCPETDSVVVIDGQFVRNLDVTVARNLADLLGDLRVRRQRLIFWNFSKCNTHVITGNNKKLLAHFETGTLDDILQEETESLTANGTTLT
ncbi:sodium-independent sulfate anion transporter-like [Cylas formicarius]|uniref:sodium-independent sulfate anion transporter-like n=1 Tax=Cylas formicarius TaxID=197179 RepID=UPI002958C355|nr:sodium-independent sulfate anion transporter-like [Cylas formicarius]